MLKVQPQLRLAALAFLCATVAAGQNAEIRIYSELQRITPFGTVVERDGGLPAREVISPAVARNGYASFHVAVTAPPKAIYSLATQTFPSNVLRIKLYRELFTRSGAEWVPDGLEEVRNPAYSVGVMPDPKAGVREQTTNVYLLDIWVPPDTPPGFVRLEVLAKTIEWRVAPMELRIQPARVPTSSQSASATLLPSVESASDASAWAGALHPDTVVPADPNVRSIVLRNASQDGRLLRGLPEIRRTALSGRLWALLIERYSGYIPANGPETYLDFRKELLRAASPAARP